MAWDKTKPANDELLSNTPALLRANWQALEDMTDAALLITNAKVAAAAGIVDTKLATISTAGKVSGAALTLLTSVPSGAGKLPLANIDSGTTANKVVVLDGSGYLPAVSGTNLTNIPCSAIASGTMAPARLGSGTAAATTYLTGAGVWGTVPSSYVTSASVTSSAGTGFSDSNTTFLSVTKNITSGKTVFVNMDGYVDLSDFGININIVITLTDSTNTRKCTVSPQVDTADDKHCFSLSYMTVALSGSCTFAASINAQIAGSTTTGIVYGDLAVIEF